MKKNGKNIVLVMSGGSGTRFGMDTPKQYCLMNQRPIIEYAFDACCQATTVDGVVVVAAEEYIDWIREKYGFPVTCGGENRTVSLANGLQYVAEHYDCKKVIVANAVCPLMTAEQIDRYFELLDSYDYVLTAWKITSTLGKYDGALVDRNDYFHCMEPEAYRFKELYENYKRDYPVPYVFHQMPENSKPFLCFDYPYTMKITYPDDVAVAEILYDRHISTPKNERTTHNLSIWLSSFGFGEKISTWISSIPSYMNVLTERWGITRYIMNPNAFTTCVYEAYSSKYGDVIVKLHASPEKYLTELEYYKHSNDIKHMAKLLEYDNDYQALLIERVKPGLQIRFDKDDVKLRELYRDFSDNMIPISMLKENAAKIPCIMDELNRSMLIASNYVFINEFREKTKGLAIRVWDLLFANAPMYFLHRDLQRRNLLRCHDEIKAIDPFGIIGPKEFEFTISILIETRSSKENSLQVYQEMMEYYEEFCDRARLRAALFITLVYKMNEYIFAKHDEFTLANWAFETIVELYFNGEECMDEEACLNKILSIEE